MAAEPETKASSEESPEKAGVEWGTWPDWVIVGFTAFLAFLSWRQHELEKRLAADTGDSLAIAKQSADAASMSAKAGQELALAARASADLAKRQLRAYVQILDATITPLKAGEPFCVVVTFRNSGATPAHDVVSCLSVQSRETGAGPPDALPEEREGFSKAPLGPGEAKPMPLDLPAPTQEFIDRFNRGEVTLYAHGEITYRDVFEETHYSRFRLYHDRTRGPASFGTCAEGNEAT
jgi:hypothetical protein